MQDYKCILSKKLAKRAGGICLELGETRYDFGEQGRVPFEEKVLKQSQGFQLGGYFNGEPGRVDQIGGLLSRTDHHHAHHSRNPSVDDETESPSPYGRDEKRGQARQA